MKNPYDTPRFRIKAEIERLANEEYRKGLERGLFVAETICNWLTGTPTKEEVLEWGRKRIVQERASTAGN